MPPPTPTTIPAALSNKVALITGASRSIGAGIAKRLIQHGCSHIAITYGTNAALAAETLSSFRELSPSLVTCAIPADLLSPTFGESTVERALQGLGVDRLNIVISCAANADVETFSPVAEMSKRQWDDVMTANAWAPLALARAAVAYMPSSSAGGGGRIIFISSVHSKMAPGDPFVAYAASKAALDSVSRNLAAAWAVEKGVTVNSISVGATRTESLRRAIEMRGEGGGEAAREFSLLRRHGEIEEVAAVVAFVASPEAGWIVGNQIPCNGGGLSLVQS